MSEHYCTVHHTKFFKTANMKSYAHPVKDAEGNTLEWCNEDKQPAPQAAPQAQPSKPEARTEWAPNPEKQHSIEAQNALTNLTNLAIAGILPAHYHDRLCVALLGRTGLNWGESTATKPGLVDAAIKAGGVPKADTGYVPPKNGQFKNVGDFLNRCYQEYGMQRPEVEALLGEPVNAKSDLDGAWVVVEQSVQK